MKRILYILLTLFAIVNCSIAMDYGVSNYDTIDETIVTQETAQGNIEKEVDKKTEDNPQNSEVTKEYDTTNNVQPTISYTPYQSDSDVDTTGSDNECYSKNTMYWVFAISILIILLAVIYVFRFEYGSFPAIVIYLFLLLAAIVLVFALAKIVPLERCCYWRTFETFVHQHPVFASILGTMLGLLITFIVLRPHLCLKRVYLYKRMKDGYQCLSVCIENKGLFPVNNVQVNMFWYREPTKDSQHPNDKDFQKELKTMQIKVFRPEINSIGGILSQNTYSCHSKEPFVESILKRNDVNKRLMTQPNVANANLTNGELLDNNLLCRVQATHSLSGLSRVYEWKFSIADIENYNLHKTEILLK